ncbi:MAG: tetratricopeptide repeat protein [Bacteroidota bacterium]
MAQAVITCGQCGHRLSLRDTVCPQCKSPVDFSTPEPKDPIICKSCGQRNAPEAEYCQSCGVRLGSGPAVRSKQQKSPKPPTKVQNGARPRDPWPFVALAAIIVLVAVVVYTEWDSHPSSPASSTTTVQTQKTLPASTTATPQEIERAREAADANPRDATLRLRLANLQQDAGLFSPAVDNYTKYLKTEPDNADARVDLGVCYYNLGLTDSTHAMAHFSSAVKEMRIATQRNPVHQPAAFNLGIVFLQMGELDSSNSWFRRTVAINANTDLGSRAKKILEQHSGLQ